VVIAADDDGPRLHATTAADRRYRRGTAILVAILWAAREALLLIYISALIAMGFSPIVGVLERCAVCPAGSPFSSSISPSSPSSSSSA
jgi:hypothetical protein